MLCKTGVAFELQHFKTGVLVYLQVIYLQTATKCMVCEEGNRSVTLAPCNHYVLCSNCASTQKECPYCQIPIVAQTTSMPL